MGNGRIPENVSRETMSNGKIPENVSRETMSNGRIPENVSRETMDNGGYRKMFHVKQWVTADSKKCFT